MLNQLEQNDSLPKEILSLHVVSRVEDDRRQQEIEEIFVLEGDDLLDSPI